MTQSFINFVYERAQGTGTEAMLAEFACKKCLFTPAIMRDYLRQGSTPPELWRAFFKMLTEWRAL